MRNDDLLNAIDRDLARFREMEHVMRESQRWKTVIEETKRAVSLYENQLQALHHATMFAPQIELVRQHQEAINRSIGSAAELARTHKIAMELAASLSAAPTVGMMAEQVAHIRATIESQKIIFDDALISPWKTAAAAIAESARAWQRVARVPTQAEVYRALDIARDLANVLEHEDPGGETPEGTAVDDENQIGDLGDELAAQFHKETIEETLAGIKTTVDKILKGQAPPSTRSKRAVKIALHVTLTIVLNIASNHISSMFFGQKPVVDKTVHKEVTTLIQTSENLPPALRVVTASQLRVRAAPSLKARPVGRLYARDCVILIERRRSWSHIEYYANDGTIIISGWVFSRYLIPISH